MRHGRGLLLGLLTATMIGCMSTPVIHTTAWLDRFRRGATPVGPDVVQMDVAVIERPIGDRTLNDTLWTYADEQVVALEHRAVLEDNGFRVGQVGGMAPPDLQNLLTSEKSLANARRLTARAGEPKQLPLGAPAAQCHFQIQREGAPVVVALEQAEYTFEVLSSLTPDGRTRLHFTPVIPHGRTEQMIRPATDRSGLMLATEKPAERYPEFGWDVTLAPNEYAVIGARYDQPQTMGHRYFVRPDETVPVQRVLVIRTSRAAPVEPAPGAEGPTAQAPPLASQASWSVVARGTAP
jgi:hypothetical protein